MFEATLKQASVLKAVLESIKDLVTEGNFECTKDGMRLQAMDSSHVSLVVVHLKGDGFEQYRCDRPQTMGISMANLAKVLKCAGKDDSITLKANDTGDSVSFTFVSPDENRISDFELKLMDIDSEHLTIPEEEYTAQVTTPSAEYARICRDLTSIGDTVTISVTKDGIKFSTSGDVGTANVMLKNNHTAEKPEEHTVISVNEPVTLTFALRYLSSFCKATPLSGQVVLGITKDLPIVVEYQIDDLGYVRYYLAPKIEDEEMDEHDV